MIWNINVLCGELVKSSNLISFNLNWITKNCEIFRTGGDIYFNCFLRLPQSYQKPTEVSKLFKKIIINWLPMNQDSFSLASLSQALPSCSIFFPPFSAAYTSTILSIPPYQFSYQTSPFLWIFPTTLFSDLVRICSFLNLILLRS